MLDLSTVSDRCPRREGILGNVLRRLRQQYPFATVQWMRSLEVPSVAQAAADSMGNLYVTDGSGRSYRYNASEGA